MEDVVACLEEGVNVSGGRDTSHLTHCVARSNLRRYHGIVKKQRSFIKQTCDNAGC